MTLQIDMRIRLDSNLESHNDFGIFLSDVPCHCNLLDLSCVCCTDVSMPLVDSAACVTMHLKDGSEKFVPRMNTMDFYAVDDLEIKLIEMADQVGEQRQRLANI
ncbi:hypothetical protein RUM43_004999 [Polyplax serrata]|uniref:Uncharacterized protein n=1 Tax=Polyplax serrata TaxID=468196 RepID=A0AAN8SDR0_POLSC